MSTRLTSFNGDDCCFRVYFWVADSLCTCVCLRMYSSHTRCRLLCFCRICAIPPSIFLLLVDLLHPMRESTRWCTLLSICWYKTRWKGAQDRRELFSTSGLSWRKHAVVHPFYTIHVLKQKHRGNGAQELNHGGSTSKRNSAQHSLRAEGYPPELSGPLDQMTPEEQGVRTILFGLDSPRASSPFVGHIVCRLRWILWPLCGHYWYSTYFVDWAMKPRCPLHPNIGQDHMCSHYNYRLFNSRDAYSPLRLPSSERVRGLRGQINL